jgi:hypothetical protein
MKKIIGIISIFALVLSLIACSNSQTTNAKVPEGFEEVSSDKISWSYLTVVKHKETGCYYILTESTGDDGVHLTQMFINKFGHSVPYCER